MKECTSGNTVRDCPTCSASAFNNIIEKGNSWYCTNCKTYFPKQSCSEFVHVNPRWIGGDGNKRLIYLRKLCLRTAPCSYQKDIGYRFPYQTHVNSLEFLDQSQYWTREKLDDLRLEGLKEITNWARKECPFYKDLPLIKDIDDIKDIPILTKSLINENFNKIFVPSVLHKFTTTGGTVSKVKVARDVDMQPDVGQWRFRNWYGVAIKKTCYLWGTVDERPELKYGRNRLWLPVEELRSKVDALKYLNSIGKFKPDFIKAYAGSLYVLARYAQELDKVNLVNGKVGVIACHCETTTSIMREVMEDVFGCDVYNFWGSRELGSMGQDCEKHKDLHLFDERYVIENINGKWIFTDLFHYSFPLIRYENQDIGEFSTSCECGRGLSTAKPLVGRMLYYLQTKSGDWVTGFVVYLPIMYYDSHFGENLFKWVEAYQVRQRQQGKLTVLLKPWSYVKPPKNLKAQLKAIQKYAKPKDFDVDVEIVDKISRSSSGKQIAIDTTLRRWKR